MVGNKFFLAAVMAVAAGLSFISCATKEEVEEATEEVVEEVDDEGDNEGDDEAGDDVETPGNDDDEDTPEDFPFETSGTLEWNVACLGHQWVEGKYRFGQMESFTVADTDDSFYYLHTVDLANERSYIDAIESNPDSFWDSLQKTLDGMVQDQIDIYGGPLERAMAGVFYKESLDGRQLNFEALGEGDYEFAVLPVDGNAKLTKQYKILSFSHTEDALEYYPWIDQPNTRADWNADFGSWASTGKSLYINGGAPGVAYVLCANVTDSYIQSSYDNLTNFINYMGSATLDYLTSYGYTFETLGLAKVDADGSFSSLMNNGGAYGKKHYYLFGFDADGKILPDCLSTEITIPKPGAMQWVERKDWAVNYNDDYPNAVVATACDATYFVIEIFPEEWSEDYSLSETADAAMEYLYTNGLTYALEEGFAFDSVPALYSFYSSAYDAVNGSEIYMFGLDRFGDLTGEYRREILAGIPKVEFSQVPGWSVTPVDGTYYNGYADVVVDAPGIQWYYAEEATDQFIHLYYDSFEYIALFNQNLIYNELSEGKTMDEIDFINSQAKPLTRIKVNNPGKESAIYLFEYDERGKATGRYGATTLVMPN